MRIGAIEAPTTDFTKPRRLTCWFRVSILSSSNPMDCRTSTDTRARTTSGGSLQFSLSLKIEVHSVQSTFPHAIKGHKRSVGLRLDAVLEWPSQEQLR